MVEHEIIGTVGGVIMAVVSLIAAGSVIFLFVSGEGEHEQLTEVLHKIESTIDYVHKSGSDQVRIVRPPSASAIIFIKDPTEVGRTYQPPFILKGGKIYKLCHEGGLECEKNCLCAAWFAGFPQKGREDSIEIIYLEKCVELDVVARLDYESDPSGRLYPPTVADNWKSSGYDIPLCGAYNWVVPMCIADIEHLFSVQEYCYSVTKAPPSYTEPTVLINVLPKLWQCTNITDPGSAGYMADVLKNDDDYWTEDECHFKYDDGEKTDDERCKYNEEQRCIYRCSDDPY